MVSDRDRHNLYVAATGALGERCISRSSGRSGRAATLMELLPPVDWDQIARKSDLAELGTSLRAEIADVRAELREFKGEMREFKGEMREFKGEMREYKGEVGAALAALHARVDVLLPRIVLANLATMIALVGLVFTIARATG